MKQSDSALFEWIAEMCDTFTREPLAISSTIAFLMGLELAATLTALNPSLAAPLCAVTRDVLRACGLSDQQIIETTGETRKLAAEILADLRAGRN